MDEWMLNDLLECSVCLERLDTSSKVLPCQHTFCRKCLEEIVSTHKELRCPECRILVELRIDDLPPNVLLMRILEGMRNAPKKRGGVSNSASTSSRPHPAMLLQQQQQGFPSSPHNPQSQQQSPGHQHHHRTYLAPHPATREHHSIRSHHSPKQGVLPNQPCAKAMFTYQSRVAGDLNFKKGDIILLKKKIDVNWYEGELAGNTGVFPSTYVQVLTPLPSHIPQCKALYDFKMTNDDEGCLTFKKGEILTVIRRVDENWAEGKLADRIGIFPLAFVELNDVARALVKLSTNSQPGPSRVAPPTPTSEDATPLITHSDHVMMVTTAPSMMANPYYSSTSSFHSAPPSQSSPLATTTTVSASHPTMPLHQANQMSVGATPLHHHHQQSRHGHHRHHHTQQPQQQPTPATCTPQLQAAHTPPPTTMAVTTTPLSSSVSSSTSSSPSSSTSSTPSSSTSGSSSSSSTAATNTPNGSSVPSSIPSSPVSPPPPPLPPPLPPASGPSQEILGSPALPQMVGTSSAAEQQPQVHQRGPSSGTPASPGSSFQLPQQYQREKRHSFNVLHSNQNVPQQSTHRHSAEILSPTATSAPEQLADEQPKDDQSEGSSGQGQNKSSQHRHRRSGSDLASTSSSGSPGPPAHEEQNSSTTMLPASYVALYPYKPQKADELELRKGSVYTVTEKCQDGWFKGTSLRTHKCGVFPGNYVALVRPPDPPPPYRQQSQNGSSPQAPTPSHSLVPSSASASRLSSATSSPSRPSGHSTSPQAPISPSPSSSRIPIASASPSTQSFTRGKAPMPPSMSIPSGHGPSASDSRHYGEPAQGPASHGGSVVPPKPPRPHSPHHIVNPHQHHQPHSLPVSSPPPELPPRSSSPSTLHHHHHFHNPSTPSLTTSAPTPSISASGMLLGGSGTPISTSSSWHACHQGGQQLSDGGGMAVGSSRGSPGGPPPLTPLSTAVTPPPNVSVGSSASGSIAAAAPGLSGRPSPTATAPYTEKVRDKKDRASSGVSLMRRLTSMKSKSKSPPLAISSYSMDNPVFEDGCLIQPSSQSRSSGQMPSSLHQTPQHGSPGTPSVHVRSGSCPSQLLQALPPDGNTSELKHHHRLLCSESQRLKHKERTSVVTANLALFGRSSPGVVGMENGSATALAAGNSGSSSSGGHRKSNSLDAGTCLSTDVSGSSGDSVKKCKQLVPAVKERFRCIVAYPPNSEYELELKVGDVIYVHRKREDGWYKGTLQRTGRTGLFPASFVEAF